MDNEQATFNITGSIHQSTSENGEVVTVMTGRNDFQGEEMRQTKLDIHRPGTSLVLFAVGILMIGLLALVSAKPAWGALGFVSPPDSPFAVGDTPTTVTSADFDKDGNTDLATSNYASDGASVLLGDGAGGFEEVTGGPVSAGDAPTSVTSADLNGDANADLAVSNESSNNVSVLLGNGDGTFRGKPDLAVGSSPTSVVGADFDGDGDDDLAVSNSASNNVSVLLGNGDGTFQTAQPYSVSVGGISPNQIITDDFDGDGDVDLATANIGNNTPEFPRLQGGVTVLIGNGDGTFQNARKVATILLNHSVVSADFDEDGDKDLVATNFGMTSGCCIEGGVTVSLGNGDGTFGTARFFQVGSGHTGPSAVASADLDRDGHVDLAISNAASDDVSVMPGNGDGTFRVAQNFPAGDLPAFVISPDLDADGVADLAVANQASDDVSVLLNTAVDVTAPRVSSVSPAHAATGVALGANVEATFSETMDPSTITDQTFTLKKQGSTNPVAARVLYDSATKKATLHPAITLEAESSYTAAIKSGSSGVKDLAGNALAADKVWTFSTVDTKQPSAPVITSPANNSIDTDGDLVIIGTAEANGTVELFEGTTSRGTTPVNASGEWSKSLSGVAEGSHTYTARARDAAGNTSDPSDGLTVEVRIPPLVESVSPADQAENVARNTNVEATFSESMDPNSITGQTFTMKEQNSSTTVAATVTYDPTTRKATLDPGSDLEANTTYTATVKGGSAGAKDLAVNTLGQDYSWTFTTAPPPDNTAPRVTGATPTGTGVGRNANARATFSERMSPASISRSTFKLFKCASTTSTTCTTQVTNVAVILSADGLRATLNPYGTSSTLLATRTKYKAVVTTGARDVAGNALDQNTTTSGNQPKTWTFTTGSS